MNVYLPNLRLPSEYQEVEYIQSSGTQYMIIGTSFKTSYKTVIDFQMTVTGGDYIPLGIKYSTTRYGIDAYNSKFMVNGGGQTWIDTISEDTNRHTITIDKGTAIVDGNNYSVSYTNYTFSQGIGVFCYNEYDKSPQYTYKSSNKLYKLDIYDENGTHIYDLVPCYRKSDNAIGLYNLVNNQFYTNAGSGTFSKGNDVTMAELKNAYIGEVWTPGSNTIAYYPLTSTSTVNDLSGNNRNLTNSGVSFQTYSGVNCAYLNGTSAQLSYSNFYNIAQGDYTINVWARRLHTGLSAGNDGYVMCIGSTSNSYKGQTSLIEFDDIRLRFAFWYDDLDASVNPEDTRTNICCQFKKSTNQQFIYVNGSLNNSRTATNTHILQLLNLVIGNRYNTDPNYNNHFKGYLSNLIFENKQWTATEVLNYYNLTKSNYGL